MLKLAITYWLVLLASVTNVAAQEPSFAQFLALYVKENKVDAKTGVPAIIMATRTADTCEFVMTMMATRSEIEVHPPADYTYINGQLLLVYDGSEQLYQKAKEWQAGLRKAIGEQLCDDKPVVAVASGGQEVVLMPCAFKFDPIEWKLLFVNGKLARKQLYMGPFLFK